ncbi:transcription elongation factor subunit Spt4 [Halococcus salifodinae]|jgi:DNA-directed RNA polymerase subunit E"|uniref:Transcription elongation factor Spt4 n=1 Tax=Halococcus salifodinae DSM 8989 TaxID=1227456 RepID=M0NAE6_9EURY|nr:transcription elongation factor subunit Spt4 [Halococcus salifodinae]EMA54523.1 DNA-directed RNA polymerase subunit E'' [Halococcus salifodinae DSM 8989]
MTDRRIACRECHSLYEASVQACPVCGSSRLTDDWAGCIIVAHPNQSDVAGAMDVTQPGTYALKVR